MDKAAPFVTVLIVGLLVALQGPTNALFGRATAAPAFAVLVSLGMSTLLLAAIVLVTPARPLLGGLSVMPWYGWLGGLYGAVILLGAVWAVPKLGAGPALVAALAAQTVVGLALDHFGAFGLDRAPVTPLKIGGLLVMVVGAAMIAAKR